MPTELKIGDIRTLTVRITDMRSSGAVMVVLRDKHGEWQQPTTVPRECMGDVAGEARDVT